MVACIVDDHRVFFCAGWKRNDADTDGKDDDGEPSLRSQWTAEQYNAEDGGGEDLCPWLAAGIGYELELRSKVSAEVEQWPTFN